MKLNKIEDIEVWRLGKDLAVEIYTITSKGTFVKDFSLKDQMRRAAVSIPSNIAEGFGRSNNNELIRFLQISKGSCLELQTQLIIANGISYINDDILNRLNEQYNLLENKISKFISYLKRNRLSKF